MTDVKCSVNSCQYHQSDKCTASSIRVINNDATTSSGGVHTAFANELTSSTSSTSSTGSKKQAHTTCETACETYRPKS